MNNSPTARAIADVKAEIESLNKELTKLNTSLWVQLTRDMPKWQAEYSAAWVALRAFDKAFPQGGDDTVRAGIVAKLDWAIRMIQITKDTITEIQRQIEQVRQSLQILWQTLRNLYVELGEYCHDQPAPPPLLH